MDLENKKEIFCKRCFNSRHPLGITFNEDQICSGCQIHDEKIQLIGERYEKLKNCKTIQI